MEYTEDCRCRVVVREDGTGVEWHRCPLHQAAPDMRALLGELLLLAAARGRQGDGQLQDLARRVGAVLGLPVTAPQRPDDALARLRRAIRSDG